MDKGGVPKGLNSKLRQSKMQGFAPRIRLPLVSTLKRKFKSTIHFPGNTLETPLASPLSLQ
jgi:hypothetical protein